MNYTGSPQRIPGGRAAAEIWGYGRKQFDIERRLRNPWGWGIAGGTIDVQKVDITAALIGRRFDRHR